MTETLGTDTITTGSRVALHYVGTLNNGDVFDSSRERGEPLNVVAGVGQMIPGMDRELDGMSTGDTKTFTLSADEAYGQRTEDNTTTVAKSLFPEELDLAPGSVIPLQGPQGPVLATVDSFTDEDVVFDLNHPLAGQDLTFEVEIVSIESETTTG